MSIALEYNRVDFPKVARIALPPVILTFLLLLTSEYDISVAQLFCALVLSIIPWVAYAKWRGQDRAAVPLFAMISFMYWLYYALPLFWGERLITQAAGADRTVSEEGVTATMFMVLLGVASLWLGMRAGVGRRLTPRKLPDIQALQSRWNYLRAILLMGIIINLMETSPYLFGEGGRQILQNFIIVVPAVIFAFLFRNYLKGESTQFDKLLVASFLGVRFLAGISSGWLSTFMSIIIISAAIYIAERRKVPALIVTVAVCFLLFFQVGKNEFRKTYWYGDVQQGSKVEKIEFWINASVNKWGEALSDPSGKTLKDVTYPSLSRVALLTQSANVYDLTPDPVPYQYGRLYTYVFITIIPRFLWPEKPSITEANQYYQVAYGLTSEDRLEQISIAVGILTEGFINFGWAGVVGIMFLLGIFFDFYERTFLSNISGALMNAIGFVLLPQFLSIESQLAAYLGGIIQSLVIIFVVAMPVMTFKRTMLSARSQPALAAR
ncbi:MAG: hypothetical protein QOD00_1241 [Blastocatellia bacterium]|jgi:hypothetical protein|nr:hypothetical protein [Blastocatellia bacterium]